MMMNYTYYVTEYTDYAAEQAYTAVYLINQTPFWLNSVPALLGAIVGGAFALFGSIWITGRERKKEHCKKVREEIYKPLYEELNAMQINILEKHPFLSAFHEDDYRFFTKVRDGWRKFDVADELNNKINNFNIKKETYLKVRNDADALERSQKIISLLATEDNLNSSEYRIIYRSHLSIIYHSYLSIIQDVLLEKKIEIFHGDYYLFSEEKKGFLESTNEAIYSELNKDPWFDEVRQKYEEYLNAQKETIALLEKLIKKNK